MARDTYAFSNGLYNDWHRQFRSIAGIDIDFIEVCPRKGCWDALAVIETAFYKGNDYKNVTLTRNIANKLGIPGYMVFYYPVEGDYKTDKHPLFEKRLLEYPLRFRVKKLGVVDNISKKFLVDDSAFIDMDESSWLSELTTLQNRHKCVK